MKALVVDDSTAIRKVLIGALGRANITDVDQAADGAEAVNAAKANQYDIILMDGTCRTCSASMPSKRSANAA